MKELDKMLECIGFDEKILNSYAEAIPYQSNKSEIMKRINKKSAPQNEWLMLGYIIIIAFISLLTRFLFLGCSLSRYLVLGFNALIGYSDHLLVCFRLVSFAVAVTLISAMLIGTLKYKNEKLF